MMGYWKHILWITICSILAPGSASTGYADDTELFFLDPTATTGGSSNTVNANPNVMFILDTSGSMQADVMTQAPWDPAVTWTGDYRTDAIYWSRFGGEPDSDSSRWFYKTVNHCNRSLSAPNANLHDNGVYQDNLLFYKSSQSRWKKLNSKHNWYLECEGDGGIHGEGANGATVNPDKLYPTNGSSGPWSSAPSMTWNRQYTLFDGNYLNWKNSSGTNLGTRMQIVKDVTKNLLDNLSGINVGLMRFNYSQGGPVLHELAPIDTTRASIKAAIDTLNASGWTPLSETMYEAGQYYTGRAVDYGDEDSSQLSVANSRINADINSEYYESPINFSCQKNYIVMLTDGEPTQDSSADSKISDLPGFQATTGQGSCSGNCLDELADYYKNYDMSELSGDQKIISHFIGFDNDLPLLGAAASAGGGEFKLATDTASLSISLTEIILKIFTGSTTFTAPSVPVNAFNRMQNLNDVFVSIFEPSNHMHWPGNLKKYRLKDGQLTGIGGTQAVDPNTGFFSTNPLAHSYWSTEADGDDAALGGAAEKLPLWTTRKIYTNLSGTSNIDLSNGTNDVSVASSVSSINLGINDDPNNTVLREQVIEWALGRDVMDDDDDDLDTDDRNAMGAPLHVTPVTMIYGGTAQDPDALVFTATNDGYLHAINSITGVEEWSFIPARLLDRIYGLYLDNETTDISYGIDGHLRTFIKNNDYNPGIDPNVETAYLIFGMRRGGQSIFAIDITTRSNPKLLWIADPTTDPALADLGQSWPAASVAKVDINGTTKHVVLMGGGYDDTQDSSGYFEDTIGNAVYMLDLDTGGVIWSAGDNNLHNLVLNTASNADANATMKHSIAASIKAIDMTGNGFIDRLYAADMGGRIWRFDIFNGATTADELVGGGLLATLGAADLATPDATDVRRFYATPDIVPIIAEFQNDRSYININIGSGHRAHPLAENDSDWFFSVRDYDFFHKRQTDEFEAPIVFSDLIDITDYTPPGTTLLSTDYGWKLALIAGSGEKVLTTSLTLDGTLFFTSFSPSARSNSCTEAVHGVGTNRLYRISVFNGNPAPHPEEPPVPPEDMTSADRITELEQGGLAPGPVAFFTVDDPDPDDPPDDPDDPDSCTGTQCEPPTPDVCIGPVCFPSGIGNGFVPTYWFQDETQ
ncbi:MAG TPA: PilC/PilY family type IV pilus protein [Gammaproteobacteria bacterium]|jgi:type IV pilus assembly protein PilY1|nr:PilC/PilY family type IV pilus protein [Gammaproteobacteria bacterium]HJP39336.1 PilC/PilY family type IV pilus protein [Gammaproteobacteria bacterium]